MARRPVSFGEKVHQVLIARWTGRQDIPKLAGVLQYAGERNMRFRVIIATWLIWAGGNLAAQSDIYISNATRDIAIVSIAPNGCSQTDVVTTDRTLSDITLHPSGRMYGCNFSDRTIYEVDLASGQTNDILTIAEANRLVGMTADAAGLLYVTEGEVVPSDLYVVDPVAGTYVNKGPLADGSAGDLTWSFGKLYNASDNNKLVEVNIEDPANSVVIGDFNGLERAGDRIFALVSVFTSCVGTQTFALSELGDYYSLDLATAEIRRLCIGSVNNYGSTSADEFLASDCFVGVDLDADNSSGMTGNDYAGVLSCLDGTVPVADADVAALASTQIDSVSVALVSGVQDGADEFLEEGAAANLSVTNGGQLLVAVNDGASLGDIEAFLSGVHYGNNAADRTPGIREIRVIAYSESETDTATAFIEIPGPELEVDIGADQTICLGESATFSSGFSPAVYDHNWSTGSNNASITTSSPGTYILQLSDACQSGTDTVELLVEDCDTVIVDPPDTTIDPPDTVDVELEEPCEPVLPTAFSPNGDNHNDRFGILLSCEALSEYDFRIYNRYGELLFSGDESSAWDGSFNGQRCPMDVYMWYLYAEAAGNSPRSWTGTVLLLY
jgi:gliding motility-associated-like protein